MEFIKPNINIDFMGKSKICLIISGIVVLLSLVLIFYPGLKYSIDFTGGTEIQIQFKKNVSTEELRSSLAKIGYPSAEVVTFGEKANSYVIRVMETSIITKEQKENAENRVREAFPEVGLLNFNISESGDRIEIQFRGEIDKQRLADVLKGVNFQLRVVDDEIVQPSNNENVESLENPDNAEQPQNGSRCIRDGVCQLLPLNQNRYEVQLVGIGNNIIDGLKQNLGENVVPSIEQVDRIDYVGPKVGSQLKSAGIKSIIYALGFILLYIAFRFDLRFGPGAIIALIHDSLITTGVFVILQREFGLQIIAALLTIIGYSINDTIVVYDRIRENLQKIKERELSIVINASINQTLSRTTLTSLTTLFTTIAIQIFGTGVIRDFALAMTVGIIVGTYSSVFIASPLTIYLDKVFYSRVTKQQTATKQA